MKPKTFYNRAGTYLPPLRPWLPLIEVASVRLSQAALKLPGLQRLVADERGQSVTTQELVATAIGVALTLLVLGVIIWKAVVALANKTAADIESAGQWGS
jgi:hypothetical protein